MSRVLLNIGNLVKFDSLNIFVSSDKVILSGEIRGPEIQPDEIEQEVRKTIKDIGYEQDGFHHEKLEFFNYLHAQSTDIAQGVDSSGNEKDEGAVTQSVNEKVSASLNPSDETDLKFPEYDTYDPNAEPEGIEGIDY